MRPTQKTLVAFFIDFVDKLTRNPSPFHVWAAAINWSETILEKTSLVAHVSDRESECLILLDTFHAEVEPSTIVASLIRYTIRWDPHVKQIMLWLTTGLHVSRIKLAAERDDLFIAYFCLI